ncbi:helix-turn-helix domain-containing protein [Epidermidibacterium keratini]|uniref:helix-turn-helix domain-containing protein n=1 Tax=Epidermidibacterium keratini TaxID=1891644 RepID=UPI001CEFA67D
MAARIRELAGRSSIAELARRTGTSRSRMSTYASGKVTPSAAMMLRIERVAGT